MYLQEQEQINQLEQALREAGIREYDVFLETQQLQDQLIAERYHLIRFCFPYKVCLFLSISLYFLLIAIYIDCSVKWLHIV